MTPEDDLASLCAKVEEAVLENVELSMADVGERWPNAERKWTDADIARAYLEGRDDAITGPLNESEANLAHNVAKAAGYR
jgi:hypothetical protein